MMTKSVYSDYINAVVLDQKLNSKMIATLHNMKTSPHLLDRSSGREERMSMMTLPELVKSPPPEQEPVNFSTLASKKQINLNLTENNSPEITNRLV